jgi:hypothetical protein
MKKYFNNSTLYMSIAFSMYFGYDIYHEIFEHMQTFDKWSVLRITKYLLIITSLFFFNKFTYIANRGKLFSQQAANLWKQIALTLLTLGILSFVELRFNNGEAIHFTSCIFLATFCLAMSNIFKDATAIKEDNDLTI